METNKPPLPPPMPEIDAGLKLPNEIDGNLEYHNAFTEAKVLDRDAQFMERIIALEADRKILREALGELVEIVEYAIAHKSAENLDSFTLQPANIAMEKTK